ncbi:putative leucine-rich repeat-containing protein DDB_G0290503 isoform X2 [Harmonia axyridis]|uniref:putative leucine-rich repeat-containing protein DDB_G0290503 isoform X2 n=1 Tax=Harmonia axyridis TaxID=115357 RepID=UPI001E2777F2|nr:putative leucine-rich repeat-containing protein DDB_G0290503 isoform X2 [Harmonia axyridis]XP_045469664.1 putative leucine-rich repeat-containing protein DDB_G0290503 isoform X2 [Harmonia axyridis]
MSQTPLKPGQKMCKSPKNSTNFHNIKHDKIDYECLSTNCTVVGSNNLNLVKKPQIVTSMSPAYSNTNSSPVYPASPYSSPASLKSPSPSLKPPTPQPQTFPVMQIIHNNHQLLARPIQQQQQNIIKLKPHLNILPKPSGSPQQSPKASVSPQIMIPTNTHQQATLMQSAQPLLLNQMPMLAATPGVQFILKPQSGHKMQTATPQGLILQQGSQQIIQLQQPRSQPMVRVLTNSVQLAPSNSGPTYVQMSNIPMNNSTTLSAQGSQQQAQNQIKRKPKAKVKKRLDLANLMKLSGIGDEDDIQFESDTSQSESEHNTGSTTPQPQQIQMQASTIQANTLQAQNIIHQTEGKKMGGLQIQGLTQPTINAAATPVVQVLNQNFQSGMISNNTSQSSGHFSPFITPNFTFNNGLMVQRSSGGFKLAMGEDGRFVLQHDPTMNHDLQSQLILQGIIGLNGGLVLQPSIDQQTVQQTVQTIQQQSVQTIQQQTVQSQTIQTVQQQTVQPQAVQHSIQALQPQIQQQTVQQTIQHQTVQSQPITAIQQPMQIVQPQPIHSMSSQVQPAVHSIQSHVHSLQSQLQGQIHNLLQQQQQNHTIQNHQPQSIQNVQTTHQPIQTLTSLPQQSPVQNVQHSVHSHQTHSQPVLKVQPFQKSQLPVQTVHPQPVQPQPIQAVQPMQTLNSQQMHSQLPIQSVHQNQQNMEGSGNQQQPTSYVVNLTPDQLEQLKRNGQLTVNGQTIFMPRSNQMNKQNDNNFIPEKKLSPKIKPVKKVHKIQAVKSLSQENIESVKPVITINHQVHKEVKSSLHSPPKNIIQAQPVQPQPIQPQKPSQPSAMVQPQPMVQTPQKSMEKNKTQNQHKVMPNTQNNESNSNQEVDKLLGQLLEESNNINIVTNNVPPPNVQHQRIHTIQLTPQKQQLLKKIQMEIQALSSSQLSSSSNNEIQKALKSLFTEQQKILATGKLLPPDKVYYHNNHLTIINPSSMNSPPPTSTPVKIEPPSPSPVQTIPQHSNNNVRRNATEPVPTYQQNPTSEALPSPRMSNSIPSTENVHQQQQSNSNLAQNPLQHTHQPHGTIQQQNVSNQLHQHHSNHSVTPKTNNVSVSTSMPPPMQLSPQQQYNSIVKKAQLIEAQLTQDQAGAVKPDVQTPFKDKKDACIRLIRYHCMDQPVLSQKDLNKADEIFEHTAKHFIAKFDKMQDKYKYLLMKESQRQVRTSELMMLDRLFLADEQQSLMQLRQEAEEAQFLDLNMMQEIEPSQSHQAMRFQQHIPQSHNNQQNQSSHSQHQYGQGHHQISHNQHLPVQGYPLGRISGSQQNSQSNNYDQTGQGPNRGGHHVNPGHQNVQAHTQLSQSHHSAHNHQQSNQNHNQSGDNLNQSSSVSYQSNHSSLQSAQSQMQSSQSELQMTSSHHSNIQNQVNHLNNEEYDEWTSIQRELGCLPGEDNKHSFVEQIVNENANNNAHLTAKRSASSDSRLETLKRFRVDKHHKKATDSVHNSVNNVVQSVSNSLPQNTHLTMTGQSCMTNRYQNTFEGQGQHMYNCLETEDGIEGKSLDEQVQSAIDSILNLQQNTALDLDSILS